MSQVTLTATVSEWLLRQRLSFHLPALHPAISIGEVAAAAQQTHPLREFPHLTLTSPPPSKTQKPISSMQLDHDLNLEWQTPQGQQGAILEQLIARINQLESRFNPVEGAFYEDLLPLSDTLAIRCLLDVFLDQQGYSQQSCGPRRPWVEDNKTTISKATGIAEANVVRIFQCASLLIPFPSFFLTDSRKYRNEGDISAHVFKANSIASAVTRLTNPNDQADLQAIFSMVLHPVETELEHNNPNITTLKGGFLTSGEACMTMEPKPVSSNFILPYIILICDFLGLISFCYG